MGIKRQSDESSLLPAVGTGAKFEGAFRVVVCGQKCWLPVATGVVQSATSPHRLKVIDAPSHERNGSPEDGKNPDNARHGQSGAPEEFLSWIPRQILSVKE